MGVKVTFLGTEPTKAETAGRVLVPRTAIHEDGGAPHVFVHRDGRVERRAVALGELRGTDQEVKAGLADGEQVVIAGARDLADGQRVTVKP
jgi:membrane fusion protein (multidrug efflux system)